MTDEEKYLFDLNGYLVVRNAIAPDAMAAMNAYIDSRPDFDSAGRGQHRGHNLLLWSQEFRDLAENPVLLPYLKELLGPHVRLDHDYAIFSEASEQGLQLHGGNTPYDPAQYYVYQNGRMHNGLSVVSYALADVPEGMGGLAVIPGSHKANFPLPPEYKHFDKPGAGVADAIRAVSLRAGDAVIFTEALTHGTFPWKASHQRRSLFYKYSPGHLSWASKYYFPAEGRPDIQAVEGELSETLRILLDPPAVHQHRRIP